MTKKDWTITDQIDLTVRIDADEWKNPTMTLGAVANILGALYMLLTNEDLYYINSTFRGAATKAMEREISARSSKANRNANEDALMQEKQRQLEFMRVKYIHDYLLDRKAGQINNGGKAL